MTSQQPGTLKSRKLHQFSERCFIENIAIRSNDEILITTFKDGSVFSLDPNADYPEARLVAQMPGTSTEKPLHLTGIVEIAPDIFAITGGYEPLPMRFERGSMKVWTLDLSEGSNPVIKLIAEGIDTTMLNGMTNIPSNPHILLSVDSNEGRVFRINTKTGDLDVVLQDPLLGPSEDKTKVPMGANGCKFRDGYLYFTNSGQQFFGRVEVESDGSVVGKPEVLVSNEGMNDPAWPCDDFVFDKDGNAYVTVHSDSVYRISADGRQELFAGGEDGWLQEPTACALSADERKLYVACAGRMGEFCGNVVEIDLPAS